MGNNWILFKIGLFIYERDNYHSICGFNSLKGGGRNVSKCLTIQQLKTIITDKWVVFLDLLYIVKTYYANTRHNCVREYLKILRKNKMEGKKNGIWEAHKKIAFSA